LALVNRTLPAALVAVLVVLGIAAPGPAQGGESAFRSPALGGTLLHFESYLPPDYATSGKHYPVVYFLHGLPSASDGYRQLGFVENALAALGHPAILIVPQGALDGDADSEYLNLGKGRNWDTALTQELQRVVDARFRTIPSRQGRALIGLSAGGYGAMHLGLEHLNRFSVVESWSGYFHPTDPSGTRSLELGSTKDNEDANVHRQIARLKVQLRSLPTFIAFYVGNDDNRFAAENKALNHELSQAKIEHVFRLYAGGHSNALWARYATQWLELALARLAPAQ
jgi:enterochelin esterase-like enzyme